MDLMGGGSRSMHASRLLAVLWLFCASLSMQVIAVGQGAAGRAAGAPAGNVAQPDTGSSDRPVARQICRAVALPDLRFSGERADGKSMPGGDPAPCIQFNAWRSLRPWLLLLHLCREPKSHVARRARTSASARRHRRQPSFEFGRAFDPPQPLMKTQPGRCPRRVQAFMEFPHAYIQMGGPRLCRDHRLRMPAALPSVLTPAMREQVASVLPFEPVTLGLDLRGGSHLVLEVDGAGLQKARLNSLLDDTRRVLRGERVSASSARISGNSVTVSIPDAQDRDKVLPKLQELATPVSTVGFAAPAPEVEVTTAGDVITLAMTEAGLADRMTKAVEQSLEIIRNRVDQVGVAEPLIQRIGSNRILVQLPGLQDPTRLRELLGSTAQMSFHMLDQSVDVTQPAPRGVDILPGANDGNRYPVESRVAISGERLDDAKVGFDQRTNSRSSISASTRSVPASSPTSHAKTSAGRLRSCLTARC